MDINKMLDIPNIFASLVDWYFDPTHADWSAKFANEDQERRAIFLIGDLFSFIREYVGADLLVEVKQRGKDESTPGKES